MHASASPPYEPVQPSGIAAWRIGAGLVQGLVLALLYQAGQDRAWPATQPLLFAPLLLAAALVPIILISGLGQLTRRQLLLWCGAAAALIVLLAVYDAWDQLGAPPPPYLDGKWQPSMPSGQLCGFMVAGFFIAHALVLSGAQERRRIASYTTYFELAWKLGVQLAFCGVFVGATWLVLQLGAALFMLVKLDFLQQAIQKAWFAIPVTAFAFSCAMHLTDMRPALVRGIRNLLLVLLSWVLPVLTLLAAGFLCSLPFTGLDALWATKSAGAVLLGAAAAFVILVNAAWQDGGAIAARPVALAARVAGLLLVPMVLLAIYALALRVQDHGWTGERVIAAACMLVASCYAGGYAAASLRRGWLPSLAGVNIGAAFVVLAVLLALFSPLADPGRLSVNDQLARLREGKVTVAAFDFAYLRFHGGRYGREALDRLEAQAAGPDAALLRARIAAVRTMRSAHDALRDPVSLAANLRVWPAGAHLPASFLAMDWLKAKDLGAMPECLRRPGVRCDAFLVDIDSDGGAEVLLIDERWPKSALMDETAPGAWRVAAQLAPAPLCEPLRQALREGKVRTLPPLLADLEIAGQRVPLQRSSSGAAPCPPAPGAQQDAARQ
ncbi:DUF4153 domain-containing protein [Massilia sp. ST3]|uniref:DUF4153 domain-containing protein n=1 Tax=Massilia sp. ST3 TaxID=2824903 RepID=UPI001B8362B6|nr:DUF4153 domain-containing protein [Massilia sp. ST3]MBQ5946547.1 DUF4153 domain-containing protein [Massilia sp. ST3]